MRIARRIIMLLEILTGILAVGGAVLLLADTSGRLLGFTTPMLRGFFQSYLWPALVLLAMGVLHLVAAWMTHKRSMWDHAVSTTAGIVLVLWISVQVILIGFVSWTQVAFFFMGSMIFYFATELWGAGEGPHFGMSDGMEDLDIKNVAGIEPAYRKSDRFWIVQHLLHRRRINSNV